MALLLDDEKIVATSRSKTSRKRMNPRASKAIHKKKKTTVAQLESLPEDILSTILSKLTLKEAIRTSILSSKWKKMWTLYPKLRFDSASKLSNGNSFKKQQSTLERSNMASKWTRCQIPRFQSSIRGSNGDCQKQLYDCSRTSKFIKGINSVLQEHSGIGVKEFEVKLELNKMLAGHLDNWVTFAMTSKTRSLALNLEPANYRLIDDAYRFPIEVVDDRAIFCLESVRLNYVSLKLPARFGGFPKLRRLDLDLICITEKDIHKLLSNCSCIEWLSIVNCSKFKKLNVPSLLSRLQYLRVEKCYVRKIQVHAVNIRTFVYEGEPIPIDLGELLQLQDVYIKFTKVHLQYALTMLPRTFPHTQNLNLQTKMFVYDMPEFPESPDLFINLKHLNLKISMHISSARIHLLASLLKAAPFMEKLELHLDTRSLPCLDGEESTRLPRHPYIHLKSVHITGFTAQRSQIDLAAYILENASELQIMIIDPRPDKFAVVHPDLTRNEFFYNGARRNARKYLSGAVLPGAKLEIL